MGFSNFSVLLLVFAAGLLVSTWIAWNFGGFKKHVPKPASPTTAVQIAPSKIVMRFLAVILLLGIALCLPASWQEEQVQERASLPVLRLEFSNGDAYDNLQAEVRFSNAPQAYPGCQWVGWSDGIVRAVRPSDSVPSGVLCAVITPEEDDCSSVPFPDGRLFRFKRTINGKWTRCN